MYCTECGKKIEDNLKYCPYCCSKNEEYTSSETNDIKTKTEKQDHRFPKTLKSRIWIIIGIVLGFILLIVSILCIRRGVAQNKVDDIIGEWYYFENWDSEKRPAASYIILNEDYTAQLGRGYTLTDDCICMDGNWELLEKGDVYKIRLTGIVSNIDGEPIIRDYSEIIEIKLSNDSLKIKKNDCEMQVWFYNAKYEKNVDFYTWVSRDRNNYEFDFAEDALYEYFNTKFESTDKRWLVDVTHDGHNDMVVVDFKDEDGSKIIGYVFSIGKKGILRNIHSLEGSSFHMGGYFSWYIKEARTGYILARSTPSYSTPASYGNEAFYEYYLDEDGNEHIIYEIYSVNFNDYTPDEKTLDYDEFDNARNRILKEFYTLYHGASRGNDDSTKGLF